MRPEAVAPAFWCGYRGCGSLWQRASMFQCRCQNDIVISHRSSHTHLCYRHPGDGKVACGGNLVEPIAERIMSDHGGSLHIQSTVGVGTTVSPTFKVADDVYE